MVVTAYGRLEKTTGKNMATSQQGVREDQVQPRKGSKKKPPISKGKHYGYIMATGTTVKEVKSNAVSTASLIQYHFGS